MARKGAIKAEEQAYVCCHCGGATRCGHEGTPTGVGVFCFNEYSLHDITNPPPPQNQSLSRLRTPLSLGLVQEAFFVVAMLLAALPIAVMSAFTNSTRNPNVVLMLADNLGYGDLGAYGSGGIIRGMPTPNLDQLASESLMLTQFFVEPGCTPSRAALMTGRYSVRSGLNSIIITGTSSTLQDEEFTIAEMFKSKGYKTDLGQELQSVPTSQGFDSYRVGILETTDGTLYPESMRRTGLSEGAVAAMQPYIWESQPGTAELRKVRPYDLTYRREIEGDIAAAAVDFIREHAHGGSPFFFYVGWSHVHYPEGAHKDFMGKSPAGEYGDMIMEHDHRVGQVLKAIDAAGIADDTLVAYLSDNGPVQRQGKDGDYLGSSPGPFRGEVGDVLEGSLRVPAMVRWPGVIAPRQSNGMVSIHGFLPTLAEAVGAKVATAGGRPFDGVSQWGFFTGETQANEQSTGGVSELSARESVISFIGGEIAAVRWRHWRIYPKQVGGENANMPTFAASAGNPSTLGVGASRMEGIGYPSVFNIARDPHETWNQVGFEAWVLGVYMKIVGEYQASLKVHPNPPAFSMTDFPR